MNIEEMKKELKDILSEYRYSHSIGTMNMAENLAKVYNIDSEKAKIVGLVHDIAKEMSKEEIFEYAQKHKIEFDEIEKNSLKIVHSKLGADICKNKYNFDEQMQKAILYHTVGNANMDMFAKVIFIADKIEENREYDGVELLRTLAFQDIDKAIIEYLNKMIIRSINQNVQIHPDSINLRNKLIFS